MSHLKGLWGKCGSLCLWKFYFGFGKWDAVGLPQKGLGVFLKIDLYIYQFELNFSLISDIYAYNFALRCIVLVAACLLLPIYRDLSQTFDFFLTNKKNIDS